jgi:hypothetical protein
VSAHHIPEFVLLTRDVVILTSLGALSIWAYEIIRQLWSRKHR